MRKSILTLMLVVLMFPIASFAAEQYQLPETYRVIDGKFKIIHPMASPSPSPTTFVNSRGLLIDGSGTLYAITAAMATPPTLTNSVLGVSLDANGYLIVNVTGASGGAPAGAAGQWQYYATSSTFGSSVALTNDASAGLTVRSLGISIPTMTFYPISSQTEDFISVCSSAYSAGVVCPTGNRIFRVTANGNIVFSGNVLALGASGQSTASTFQLFGASASNGPYIFGGDNVGGNLTYLYFDPAHAGIPCITTSAPSGACSAGTLLMINSFPITVGGTVTSGGVPYFNSTTQMSTSAALAAHALVQGGGAGSAPATGNGDFTIDSTAHTFLAGASGLVDLSAETTATGFKLPVVAGATASADGVLVYDSTNKNTHMRMNTADACAAGEASAMAQGAIPKASSSSYCGLTASALTDNGIVSSSEYMLTASNRVFMTADWTCGTGGTVSSCVAATIVGTSGTALTLTLPSSAQTWHWRCWGVVTDTTGTPANNWAMITSSHGATNVTACYTMGTAATVLGDGCVTDQASTTTTFNIGGTWTLGAAGTSTPFNIEGTIEGVSASGTVVSLQVVDPTVGDLLTIYRGAYCSVGAF